MNYCDMLMQQYLLPLNWIQTAEIYNKRFEIVPYDWLIEEADVLVLLFSAKGVDKDDIVRKFYQSYEDVKYTKLPIEVIYVPMDEKLNRMKSSFKHQANWFTLKYDEPLILTLKYMYGITCIPRMIVIKLNGEIISSNGILDLERYGKNAIITWISPSNLSRVKNKEDEKIYHEQWEYMKGPDKCGLPEIYDRKFSPDPLQESSNESIAQEIKTSKSVGIKSKAHIVGTVPKETITQEIEGSKSVARISDTAVSHEQDQEEKETKNVANKSVAQISDTELYEDIEEIKESNSVANKSIAQMSDNAYTENIAEEVKESKSITQISGTALNEDVEEVKESQSGTNKSMVQISGTVLKDDTDEEVKESKSVAQMYDNVSNENIAQEGVKESKSLTNETMAQVSGTALDEIIAQEVKESKSVAMKSVAHFADALSNDNLAQEVKESKSVTNKSIVEISGTEEEVKEE